MEAADGSSLTSNDAGGIFMFVVEIYRRSDRGQYVLAARETTDDPEKVIGEWGESLPDDELRFVVMIKQ